MNGRDDGALDALLFLAFLEEVARESPPLSGPEPTLDPADERALDALGPDLVRRVLQGDA